MITAPVSRTRSAPPPGPGAVVAGPQSGPFGPVIGTGGPDPAVLIPVSSGGRPLGAFVCTAGRVRYRPVVAADRVAAAAAAVVVATVSAAAVAAAARRRRYGHHGTRRLGQLQRGARSGATGRRRQPSALVGPAAAGPTVESVSRPARSGHGSPARSGHSGHVDDVHVLVLI